MKIGDRIRMLRENRQLSQDDLAKRCAQTKKGPRVCTEND